MRFSNAYAASMPRSKKRKADLLEAAQRAMAEHGAGVRLNQVAEEAGLTSGAILYHYKDLQELLVDANRAGMERFYDERLKAIEGIDDPARRLVATIASGLPVDGDDEEVCLLCALGDRESTRLNSSHIPLSRMPSSA